MDCSEKVLFELIKESLFRKPGVYLNEIDWNSVINEAKLQGVYGLINEHLLIDNVIHLDGYYYQNIATNIRKLQAQNELIQLLDSYDIPSAIIKGSAAAIYYPIPCCRTMGDIDFIVPNEYFDYVSELMINNGYSLSHSTEIPDTRHVSYSKNGILFELHHHFSYSDLDIEKFITEGFKRIERRRINSFVFPMLPPKANGFILLAHMRRHLQSGMGLRQMIDWMMYVDKQMDDEMWENNFKIDATEMKLDALAVTATHLCQMFLGLDDNKITWCKKADEKLCERLLELIMISGNFGVKIGSGFQIETVATSIRRYGLLKYMQQAGENNWKAYKRYSFLKPLCWAYQIIRCCQLGMSKRRGKQALLDIKRSKERYDVLRELKLM